MRLASIFTDHMVFQAKKPIKIFGEGKGTICISFVGEEVTYFSETDEWCVTLPEKAYGGPYELKVTLNGEEIIIHDVYIGEVWLACGQSNMELPLFRVENGIEDAQYADNDKIRFFTVPRRIEKNTPIYGWHSEKSFSEDTPWQISSEKSALHFSAIGYYVAKGLQEKLQVAVGVVSCNWGAKTIEAFIRNDYFEQAESLKKVLENYNQILKTEDLEFYKQEYQRSLVEWKNLYDSITWDEIEEVREKGIRATARIPDYPVPVVTYGPYNAKAPGRLYDAMISRIVPFGAKGVLWYQGEGNQSDNYLEKYLVFMKCMRETFQNKDLAFYAVELASCAYMEGNNTLPAEDRFVTGNNWAFTRQQQQMATELEENNYLVTSMELGELYNVHPIHKKPLAHRILRKVLRYSYGMDVAADQPIVDSVEFKGSKVYIRIKNSDGLYCNMLPWVKMYLADDRHVLQRAEIEIKDEMLVLSCKELMEPTVVQYAFDYHYAGSYIYNKAGLPLAPFRVYKNCE